MDDHKSNNTKTEHIKEPKTVQPPKFANKLPAAGWGLFFIWIGIALLLKLPSGIILLGIGTITLLVQVFRKYLNLRIEIFYVVVGMLFMLGGFWENYKPDIPLIPVFLIVVGTGFLLIFIKNMLKQ